MSRKYEVLAVSNWVYTSSTYNMFVNVMVGRREEGELRAEELHYHIEAREVRRVSKRGHEIALPAYVSKQTGVLLLAQRGELVPIESDPGGDVRTKDLRYFNPATLEYYLGKIEESLMRGKDA